MKILGIEFEYAEDEGDIHWGNLQSVVLKVDKLPSYQSDNFEKRGDLYFRDADENGLVSYFCWHGKPDRGFGSSSFPITLTDGTPVTLVGPWSSSSSAMNKYGFTPSIEVVLRENKYVGIATAMTVKRLTEIMQEFSPDWELVLIDFYGMPAYLPHYKDRTRCTKKYCKLCRPNQE